LFLKGAGHVVVDCLRSSCQSVCDVTVVAGFNRDIPGFPTYSMNGSISLGEHHLVIESVQLSDDAEFQCQVTPAGGDPPLVGTARLSVVGQSHALSSIPALRLDNNIQTLNFQSLPFSFCITPLPFRFKSSQ